MIIKQPAIGHHQSQRGETPWQAVQATFLGVLPGVFINITQVSLSRCAMSRTKVSRFTLCARANRENAINLKDSRADGLAQHPRCQAWRNKCCG